MFDLISHISDLRLSALCLCAFAPLYLTKLSSFVILFMQNKPNVKDAQINVNSYIKSIYEKLDTWLSGKNKPNLVRPALFAKELPDCSNPMSKQLVAAKPRRPESAKMAQIFANRGVITVQAESIKKPLKKPNLLKIKMLSSSHRPVPPTGTSFAHLEYMR